MTDATTTPPAAAELTAKHPAKIGRPVEIDGLRVLKKRRCCDTPLNLSHRRDCPGRGGRKVTTGTAPARPAGRHSDDIWDPCVLRAAADGQNMSQFVGDAIRRELALRQLAAEHGTSVVDILDRLAVAGCSTIHPDAPCRPCYRPDGFAAPEVAQERAAECAATHPHRPCTPPL